MVLRGMGISASLSSRRRPPLQMLINDKSIDSARDNFLDTRRHILDLKEENGNPN